MHCLEVIKKRNEDASREGELSSTAKDIVLKSLRIAYDQHYITQRQFTQVSAIVEGRYIDTDLNTEVVP